MKERFARIAALASLLALAGCDPDDVGGTLDGSVCGLAFDSVRAVRGGAELTIQYQKGRETALGVSVDPADIVEGEAIPLPPTALSRSTGGTICELPDSCDPAEGPTQITFSTFEDRAGGRVAGEFLACFDDAGLITNAHGTFDVELTLVE